METKPEFIFGGSYAIFFGDSSQNDLHQNLAFQIILGLDNDIKVFDEDNNEYSGRICLIKPLVKSKIQYDGRLSHLYLSPRHNFSLDLITNVCKSDIHTLDANEPFPIDVTMSQDEIVDLLNKLEEASIESLDDRLLKVLEYLDQNLDNPSILDAAKRSGLSRSRVRALAREEIGIPLSTWVTWRKLIKANKALFDGANLSDAALAGCFSDQAHFSRTMKRMFGVTPSQASLIYT